MNRQQKKLVVKSLKQNFKNNQASFIVDYKGMAVSQLQLLRRMLDDKKGTLKVAKVRLVKRAIKEVDTVKYLMPFCKDQIALVFAPQEPAEVAKVLYNFVGQHKKMQLVAGCFESKLLHKNDIIRIATLPSKKVLFVQLCYIMKMPTIQFIQLLRMVFLQFLWILKQRSAAGDQDNNV